MRRFGVLFCCVVAATALLLSGCGTTSISGKAVGQGGTGGSIGAALDAMSDDAHYQATQKKTVHVQMVTTGGAGAPQHSEGDYRFGDKTVEYSFTMSGGAMAEFLGSSGGAGQIQMIFVDGVGYIKGLPTGSDKPWIKLDPDSDDPMSKTVAPILQSSQQYSDPVQTLEMLKSSGHVTSTSEEQLDGQLTTHYSVTVDTKRMVDNMPDSEIKRLAQTGVSALPPSYPVDIWINQDKLPAKMVLGLPVAGGKAAMTVTYSHWGEPVNITAPPSNQVGVFSIPSLTGGH